MDVFKKIHHGLPICQTGGSTRVEAAGDVGGTAASASRMVSLGFSNGFLKLLEGGSRSRGFKESGYHQQDKYLRNSPSSCR
jgi:hypothetical protein